MYEKNLTEDLRLRLSKQDMDFLRSLSNERGVSLSEVIRSIISEYRRSLDTMNILKQTIELAKKEQEKQKGGLSHGDTKTDLNNLV